MPCGCHEPGSVTARWGVMGLGCTKELPDRGRLGLVGGPRSPGEGTRYMKRTSWSAGVGVTGDGVGVVRHAGDVVVLDVDATIGVAHSDKEQAAPTIKRTFGSHRSGCGATTRASCSPRACGPGTRARTTRPMTWKVPTQPIGQASAAHRKHLLIRDGAGASHGLVEWLTSQDAKRLECGVQPRFPITTAQRKRSRRSPPQDGPRSQGRWGPAREW